MPVWIGHHTGLSLGSGEVPVEGGGAGRQAERGVGWLSEQDTPASSQNWDLYFSAPRNHTLTLQPPPHFLKSLRLRFPQILCEPTFLSIFPVY